MKCVVFRKCWRSASERVTSLMSAASSKLKGLVGSGEEEDIIPRRGKEGRWKMLTRTWFNRVVMIGFQLHTTRHLFCCHTIRSLPAASALVTPLHLSNDLSCRKYTAASSPATTRTNRKQPWMIAFLFASSPSWSFPCLQPSLSVVFFQLALVALVCKVFERIDRDGRYPGGQRGSSFGGRNEYG